MGYHGNGKMLLPWGVQLHRVFYSVDNWRVQHFQLILLTIILHVWLVIIMHADVMCVCTMLAMCT